MKRGIALVYVSLLANVVIFFHKPLFSLQYSFPWDFRTVQLPLMSFLADELREGRFALWNPFSYCGNPIFANIEASLFHPFVLASAFISSHTSLDSLPVLLEWSVALQVWFAGIAAYYLFLELGAGMPAAWAGAVMFQTGGFFASQVEHIPAMMAAAWMPLAWLSLMKLRENFHSGWLAALGAALGMSVLGGFPATTLAVFVSTALLAVLLATLKLSRARVIAYAACGCVLGIALAAIQFIPTTQLTEHSVAKFRAGWLGAGGGLYWGSLVTLISPNHYNIFDMSRFKGPGDPTFLYLYSSIAGLSLAIIALAVLRNRRVALLAVMALFGLVWMLGDKTPLWRSIYPLLPEKVRIGIHPEYTYCMFGLSLAGLAAMGLESIRMAPLVRWAIAIVIATDLFLVGSGRPMNLASAGKDAGLTRNSFDGNTTLLPDLRSYINRDFPPTRIDTVDASLAWSWGAPLTRIPTAGGISPLAPADVIQLRLFLHDGFRWGWYYPVEKFDSPVLDLMNVKYLMAGTANAAERLRALPRFRHVATLPGNELFENLTVMPRFFLVHEVQPVRSLEEATEVIRRGEIDFRKTALVDQPITLPTGGNPEAVENVEVVNYQPASLELSISAASPSLLVMSESYYPGWKAWLDGKPAPIHRADIAFRGVAVPAGKHHLRMQFRPVILPVSAAISLSAAIFLVILAASGRAAQKRARYVSIP